MKLLLDENLSPRIVELLSDVYPDSVHVHQCGLGSAGDSAIWEHAKKLGFTIVSKDSGFEERSVLFGTPPKIILIRTGNCRSSEVERLLRTAFADVKRFVEDDQETCLILGHKQANK